MTQFQFLNSCVIIIHKRKDERLQKKKKKEILAFDFESLKCGIMSEEQGMLWRPSFPRVEAGR